MEFEIILQECSLGDPLPKLPNGFAPLNKMATGAKNRITLKRHLLLGHWMNFEIISQECSLGDPLPKLPKWFRSAKQMAATAKNRKTL